MRNELTYQALTCFGNEMNLTVTSPPVNGGVGVPGVMQTFHIEMGPIGTAGNYTLYQGEFGGYSLGEGSPVTQATVGGKWSESRFGTGFNLTLA